MENMWPAEKATRQTRPSGENAASGGMITAFLCYLLRTGKIDGAWVSRTKIVDGQLGYDTFIATTEEELRDASSSIYMSMPLLKSMWIW